MNFTSYQFVVFFIIALFFGHILKNRKQKIFLLLASYYFYGAFEPWYLILIILSTLNDYIAGIGIAANRKEYKTETAGITAKFENILGYLSSRTWLSLSLTTNLGLLAYFKYTNFGIQVFNDLQPYGDTAFAYPFQNILLPVGISFYTFQSLSYTIDVYRGILKARRSLIDFALYVSFFPQLVAGPIVRATTFLDSLDKERTVTREDMVVGTTRIVVGFFKKVVMADNLGVVVNTVFANPAIYGPADMWTASIGFGFQIYLDFSGYTDIARGVARLFGFEFEINFLYPMASANISEHWKRWHISLTTWMRDYVYIPLGGSRVTPLRFYRNMFLTWFGVGLWHGASYHFILWGLWQALLLSIHRAYQNTRLYLICNRAGGKLYSIFSRIATLFFLTFGFIWFRAETTTKATLMQGRLFGIYDLPALLEKLLFRSSLEHANQISGTVPTAFVHIDYAVLLILFFIYEYTMDRIQMEYFWKSENRGRLVGLLIFMIFCIIVFASPTSSDFLYFQF